MDITKEYQQHLVSLAKGEFGCRMIRSSIFELTLQAYVELLKTGRTNAWVKLDIDGYQIPLSDTTEEFLKKKEQWNFEYDSKEYDEKNTKGLFEKLKELKEVL